MAANRRAPSTLERTIMGYAKVKDFDRGPLAALWATAVKENGATEQIGDDRFPLAANRKAAERVRYQLNGFRYQARAANVPEAVEWDAFVVKIVELDGKVFIKLERDVAWGALQKYKTDTELQEEKEIRAMSERLLATQRAVDQSRSGVKATAEDYVPRSAAAVAAHAQGAPEHILRALDRAEDLRAQGVLAGK